MISKQLELLVDTAQHLSLARNLDTIIEIVSKAARNLTGADGATFVLKEKDLCYYANEDAIGKLWKGQKFPMTECISGWAMIHKQSVVIEDIYSDKRIPLDAYKKTFVKSLAMVPIRTIDPIGAIGNYWAKEHSPTAEEIHLLQSLANLTSVSIENVSVYKELEDKVKQRTEQLEVVNKELEGFTYSVSHDLQAPLRAINGYADILNKEYEKTLDEEAKRLLENISYYALKMSKLINDLLTFSRLGRKEISKEKIDMNELTDETIYELCKSTSHSATIEINKLHTVQADYSLMQQVMLNLISNAVKYSSKNKKPQIKISSTEANGDVIFTVADNGVGFDMKYAHKLFGVFQRLHSQEEFEGTGVGLSLVQRIITKHGGKVWADGKLGKGATFNFLLRNN